ncbi:hypothetical protein HPB52_022254 [Rhipicephalus sanguineus]|uniref:Tick transposon n=1 Tax=Rhipicephalus sanguineus TaxID=34632 RepID=A0A9D4Q328_RHISA|nr:hypothetical protein HPB52_022254 [Rhipicephalus sanguineus]
METRDVCLAAVSDPYRPSRRLPSLPHGYLAYAVAEDPQAIIVTRNPPFDVCPVHVSSNVVAIFCESETFNFVFVSAYAAPHSSLEPILDELSAVLRTRNAERRYFLTHVRNAFFSQLDRLMSAGHEWFVGEDTTFSEHRLVEVRVGETPTQEKRLTSYARRSFVWPAPPSRLPMHSTSCCPDSTPYIRGSILVTFDRFGLTRPVSRGLHLRSQSNARPWPLNDAVSNVHEALRCASSFVDSTLQLSLLSAITFARRATYMCVVTHFLAYVVHSFRNPSRRLSEDGTLTSTHLESASLLLHTQIAVDDPMTDEAIHASTRALVAEPYISRYQDVPFTYSEVVDVLRNTPNRSAPGPDHISPVIMKALFKFHPCFFLMVFNAALHLGYFPRCWRTARVSFIHKPGHPPERTSSYRPICVSSVFGKTLERLLNGRLQHFLLKRDLIRASLASPKGVAPFSRYTS